MRGRWEPHYYKQRLRRQHQQLSNHVPRQSCSPLQLPTTNSSVDDKIFMILFCRQETDGQVSGDDAGQQLQQDQAGLQDQGLQPGN